MPNGGAFEDDESESDNEASPTRSKSQKPRDKGKAHIILSQSEYRKFDQSLSSVDNAVHSSKIKQSFFS